MSSESKSRTGCVIAAAIGALLALLAAAAVVGAGWTTGGVETERFG